MKNGSHFWGNVDGVDGLIFTEELKALEAVCSSYELKEEQLTFTAEFTEEGREDLIEGDFTDFIEDFFPILIKMKGLENCIFEVSFTIDKEKGMNVTFEPYILSMCAALGVRINIWDWRPPEA